MTTRLIARGAVLMLGGVLLAACDNRGTFGPESCAEGDRIGTPAGAVAAIYFDKTGPVGTQAEELKGTENNKMCPTPEADPDDPGACPGGYCSRTYQGKTFCVPC